MIFLGIDPGTTRAGYGLIEKNGSKLTLVEAGLLKATSDKHTEQLLELNNHLVEVIKKYEPVAVGVEKLYFSKNVKTGIAVAESRGSVLLTLAKTGLGIFEFDPSEIKSCITGSGKANKVEVKKSVELILGQTTDLIDDAVDALAIAILTAAHYRFK